MDELLQLLGEYLEEVEALIDADEGEVFDGAFLRKHEKLKEVYDGLD